MTTLIAVDPGADSGAIACFIDSHLLDVIDMPCADGKIAASLLRAELREFALAGRDDQPLVVIEQVHSMPGNGSVSSFKFGRSLGVIEGVVAGLGWPVLFVSPQRWKGHHRLLRQEKDAARMLAIETWPSFANTHFKRKKDVGRADAALIGSWAVGL